MAPLKPTSTASMSVALGSQVYVEINTGTVASPTWTEVKGIQKFSYKFEQKTEDDSDISMGAFDSEFPTGNAFSVSVSGLVKGDESGDGFVVDPGVQALLDASKTYGRAGVSHLRFGRTDGIPEAYEFFCTTKVSLGDKRQTELQDFSGDLKGKGEPEDIWGTFPPQAPITKTITVGSGVTAFTITLGGSPTASITYNGSLTAAAVQTAVRAVAGMSTATVTGSNGGPFTLKVPYGTTVSATGTGGTVTVA